MTGRILLIFLLALSALVATAYFAGSALDTLVNSVRVQSEPSRRISVLQDLEEHLVRAENSVRSYAITGNAEDLSPYYRVISLHDRRMEYLWLVWDDSVYQDVLTELSRLLGKKMEVMQAMVALDPNDRVERVLDRVKAELSRIESQEEMQRYMEEVPSASNAVQAPAMPETLWIPESESGAQERFGFLRRIFSGRRDRQDRSGKPNGDVQADNRSGQPPPEVPRPADLPAADTVPEQEVYTGESSRPIVQDVLDRVSREELAFQSMRSKKLRQLLSEDRSISDQIAAVTAHMERQERLHYQNNTRGAALRASTTKWLILFALSASATLLILLIGVILRDMTRLRRNRTQLRTAVEEAEKLARVKQEFLSNMSHEIRTPLTAIAGFAEQLNQSSLDEAQKRQLDRLMRAAGHLQSLEADLLDMSKMEQGALVLQKVPFSLKQTMSDVLDIFRGTARNKGIELRYQPPDGDADLLMGDPLRLRQILINLLGNAITFTDEGYVALRCRLESRENGWMLLVEVEDSGIGIPEGEHERIFEVFTQVDNALTRRHGGTGLGLSIVKYLVELHGGEIRVHSQVGTGTVFFVQLPCVPADSGSTVEIAREGHPPYPSLRGRRILVVDDDPFIRELIGTIFQKREAGVVQVPDAASALEQIRSHTFDLILMDLRMPGLSGADAVRVIRRLQPGVHQPIVAVTADSGVSGLAESGFDGALVKPFTQEEIELLVYRFLEPGSTAEAVVTGPSDQEAGDDRFSLDELQAMSGGNPDFVRDMVVMYLKNMADYFHTLEQAAGEGAWQQVGDIAHKAAPACRHLGLRQLAATFRRLEQYARASDAGQAEVEMVALKHAWSLQSANVELAMQSLNAHPGEAAGPDREERIARID